MQNWPFNDGGLAQPSVLVRSRRLVVDHDRLSIDNPREADLSVGYDLDWPLAIKIKLLQFDLIGAYVLGINRDRVVLVYGGCYASTLHRLDNVVDLQPVCRPVFQLPCAELNLPRFRISE